MRKTLAGIVLSCVIAAPLLHAAVLEILQALPQQRLLQQLATALPQQQPLRTATRLYVSQQ